MLKHYRTRANLSQAKLSDLSGISRSMIAQIELVQKHPSRKVLNSLAKTLDLTGEEQRQFLKHYGYVNYAKHF